MSVCACVHACVCMSMSMGMCMCICVVHDALHILMLTVGHDSTPKCMCMTVLFCVTCTTACSESWQQNVCAHVCIGIGTGGGGAHVPQLWDVLSRISSCSNRLTVHVFIIDLQIMSSCCKETLTTVHHKSIMGMVSRKSGRGPKFFTRTITCITNAHLPTFKIFLCLWYYMHVFVCNRLVFIGKLRATGWV